MADRDVALPRLAPFMIKGAQALAFSFSSARWVALKADNSETNKFRHLWYYLTCSKKHWGQGCGNALSSQFACLQSMLNAKLLKLYTARVNHSSADPVKLHLGWTCGTCCIWMSKKPIESFTEAVPSNTCTMVKGHHTSHTLTHVPFKPWPWQVLRHADLHWGEEGVILAFSHESLQTALVVARTRTCSKQSQSDSTFKVWRYAG